MIERLNDELALGAGFPAAAYEGWRQLVDEVLKGGDFDNKLVARTLDGLRIEPLYPRNPGARPIIGRAPGLDHVTVACAGGAGMMWGPGVARAAADVALTGSTDVLDVSSLGLDRFDEAGRSRLASDPIALPFPERISAP